MSISWKVKGSGTRIDLNFFPHSLETFPELYFSILTYIYGDDSFFFSFLFFFFSKDGRLQKLCLSSFFPPSLPITAWQKGSTKCHDAPWGQIAPGPPASHFTYRVSRCSGNFKGIKKSQICIEILVAWVHVSMRRAEFSFSLLWHIYSCHKNSSWVAGRSHSLVWNFPQKANKGFSQVLGLQQGSASCSAQERWGRVLVIWNKGLHSAATRVCLLWP